MWRYAVVAAGIVLAVLVVLHFRGGSDHEKGSTTTTASAPQSTDTGGARVVHYRLHGRDEIAIVPKKTDHRLLVFLHASGSGPQEFLTNQVFAALPRFGAPVVVLLNGGDHSYWHDRSSGKWASMVLDTAIPDAKRRFHLAGKVAIGGLSMGGYGALHIASLRPETFCAVGGHSAALWHSAKAAAPGAFDNADDFKRNNVFRATAKLKHLPVWLDAGDQDPFRTADGDLARKLSVILHVYPGGHDSTYWNGHMPEYFAFYGQACRL
jgi:pimeloyl-ACP methyl ester carboxylesterase